MRQTSIRLTASAREALARLCARSGTKVEPTVRRLLEQFVERQQAIDEERRLTHLAIALGHPPRTRLPGDPPPTGRLAIRLPIELQRAAESFAYRIPGRPARQSHRDYASRPLSGVVTTAIALAEPFQEPELEGLPVLVEQRLGDGLWRLTAAASLTGEERRALGKDPAPLPQMLVDGEVMWHSPERSALALQIATNLLTGPGAAEHLAILSAQQEDFQEWIQELTDPRVIYGGHTISDGAAPLGGNKEGRAATAIWRARRILALEELAAWLTSDHPAPTLELDPPSWTLTMPPGWHTVRFPRNSPAPAALHAEWEQGHVLRIDSGRSSAFWPVTSSGAPLPRLAPVLASTGLTGTDPTDKLRLAEMLLLREGSETDPSGLLGPLFIDVESACTAGLITPAERDDLVADADAETTRRISRVLAMLERTAHRPPEVLEQLRALTHSPPQFSRLCAAHEIDFSISRPFWHWPIPSIPAALDTSPPLTGSQLALLGREWRRRIDVAVERDQHGAWTAAMWDHRALEIDQTQP